MTTSADAVDELCRLALAAQRLGCQVRLVDVRPELRELLVAAGVEELLVDRGWPGPSRAAADRGDLR